MSFFKFKSLVLFIKIVTKLLLLRPFGKLIAAMMACNSQDLDSLIAVADPDLELRAMSRFCFAYPVSFSSFCGTRDPPLDPPLDCTVTRVRRRGFTRKGS